MPAPPKPFGLGDIVAWKTPQDQQHWERDYARLLRLYSEGPFEVEALYLRSSTWLVVLKGNEGTMNDRKGAPQSFSASWLKLASDKAAR